MVNSHKGLFLETLINITANYYKCNNICIIEKRQIPVQIIEKINKNFVKCKLASRSKTDYFGCFNSFMFDFEAKQTQNNNFNLNLVKQHQLKHIFKCSDFGIHSFVLIHFVKTNDYFIINANQLKIYSKKTEISYQWIKHNCYELELIFPGILNLEKYLLHIFGKIKKVK